MKSLRKTLLTPVILVVSCLLLSTQSVFADVAPIAQVVWTKGRVSAARPNNTTRELTRRAPIYIRDTIITGANSEGQIVFTDQSTLALRPNSALKIVDYQARAANVSPTDEKYVLELVKGGMRTVSGLIGKDNPEGYAVKTPVATIGIRGTEYSVVCAAPGEGASEDDSGCATAIYKGVIDVRNTAGGIVITAGSATPYSMIKSASAAPQAKSSAPRIIIMGGGDPSLQAAKFQPGTFGPSRGANAVCIGG
jgi:hypothetical protein